MQPERQEMMTLRPLPGPFGAEITGLDLAVAPDEAIFGRIVDALHEYAVVCIRDQRFAPPQHIDFSRRFGELEVHVQSSFNLQGFPEIYCISNCLDAGGKPLGLAEAGRVWHTDLSYMAEPSRCSLLHALEVPQDGEGRPLGDTMFANARMAYAALPAPAKARLAGLEAVHSYRQVYEKIVAKSKPGRQGLKPLSEEQKRKVPPATHPLVIAHPYTGAPILFCNDGITESILGLPEGEGPALLAELCAHVTKPAFVYRHKWQAGDLLIWDNIQTQHLAVDDYWLPQRRRMQRTTVKGRAPEAVRAA
ncbi:MAG: TauD/TfdA family dioxygenase [Alphaproteobacteria bacterium]|nr:TauD/TfdA family dioxygenase [Alphaproteobacteria bacterium]